MTNLKDKCYWHEWAKNKVELLSKEEILKHDNIIDCYRCKSPNECPSYLPKFYLQDKE
jgi:hypothetical protein